MRAKITKATLDAFLAKKNEKDLVVFDTELSGFCVKLTPAGRAVFQVRFRMNGRRSPLKTHTLGRYGEITPDQARKAAQIALGNVRAGVDPSEERKRKAAEDRAARSIEDLSQDFLKLHGKKLKSRSTEAYESAFRLHINPRIGKLAVRDVTHGDIEAFHDALSDTPVTANRSVSVLSKFFAWAIRGGYRPDHRNPCKGITRFPEQARERFLSDVEIAALGRAIADSEASGDISKFQGTLFRVLLMTGLRRDEWRLLQWSSVDFARQRIRLPDTKTGPRHVRMSPPVADLLRSLPRIANNPHVFAGRNGKPLRNTAKPWRRVLNAAGLTGVRLHDLRHSAASIAIGSGASLPMVGKVLGHNNEATTRRYSHIADDLMASTADLIAERVAAAMSQSKSTSTDQNGPDRTSSEKAFKRRVRTT